MFVKIRYLEKLDVYQEILAQDKKFSNDPLWNMQKAILYWTVKEHKHLSTHLTPEHIKDILEKQSSNKFTLQEINGLYKKVLSELSACKYAKDERNPGADHVDRALINKKGMLAGEVISDLRSRMSRLKYKPILWLSIVSSFLVMLANYNYIWKIIKQITNIFK